MTSEVEETFKRIQSQKGVIGVIAVTYEGVAVKTTLDNATTTQYVQLISSLSNKARTTVKELDPTNDMTFLRLRSKKNEIMVAPEKDYMLIVVQNFKE